MTEAISAPTPLLPDAQRVAEIEGRLERATGEKWTILDVVQPAVYGHRVVHQPGDAELGNWMMAERIRRFEDANLIANAPTDLRYLLTQLAAVSAERDEARKAGFAEGAEAALRMMCWECQGGNAVNELGNHVREVNDGGLIYTSQVACVARAIRALMPTATDKGEKN